MGRFVCGRGVLALGLWTQAWANGRAALCVGGAFLWRGVLALGLWTQAWANGRVALG